MFGHRLLSHLLGVAALLAVVGTVRAETPVERGSYLVNSILTCGNCHTPRGPGGVFAMDKQLSGGPQTWDEPPFTVKGANITPDKETGIGTWSDADIKRAMLEGVRPNGVKLAPIMPYAFYRIMTPSDLDAVVAYVRSVPPVKNGVEPPVYKAAFHVEPFPGSEKPMPEADMRDPVKRGFYLATIGHCMECHTPMARGELQAKTAVGKGGRDFPGPWGTSISRNITSHKTAGIGDWSDAEIKRAITQGIRKDGTPLKPPMGYPLYAKMTEADLSAVVAYLRTVPPLE